MQLFDSAILITEIALALAKPLRRRIAIVAPFIHTAIWILSPIWSQPSTLTKDTLKVPDLGVELEPEVLVAAIDRAIYKPVPTISVAQAVAEPMAALSFPAKTLAQTDTPQIALTPYRRPETSSLRIPSKKLRKLASLYRVKQTSNGKCLSSTQLRAALQPYLPVEIALP